MQLKNPIAGVQYKIPVNNPEAYKGWENTTFELSGTLAPELIGGTKIQIKKVNDSIRVYLNDKEIEGVDTQGKSPVQIHNTVKDIIKSDPSRFPKYKQQ